VKYDRRTNAITEYVLIVHQFLRCRADKHGDIWAGECSGRMARFESRPLNDWYVLPEPTPLDFSA